MAHFDYTFGVEIECFLPEDSVNKAALADAISRRLGQRNACQVQVYAHTVPTNWKIITDGSLGNYERGIEVVSPILRNQEGLDQVAIVCRALSDFGCTVNKKCGLHVHVGVGNASLKFWKDIVSLYSIFEPVLDKMMPPSRRASQNTYCRTMTTARMQDIQSASTFRTLSSVATPGSRYHKVNMQAYLRYRTIEFRQHSGTTDATKACNWILICLKMVHLAKHETFNYASFNGNAPRNTARPGTKNHLVVEMLLRPQGVTSHEALQATGWTSISIPETVRPYGINFTSQKTGRITRYFAVRSTTAQVTIDSFATLINLNDDERTYMHNRTNDLAGQVAWAA